MTTGIGWIDEYMERPARTRLDDHNEWPWCPDEGTPHDYHLVNEGNTLCGGHEGIVPMISKAEASRRLSNSQLRMDKAQKDFDQAVKMLRYAEKDLLKENVLWNMVHIKKREEGS